MGLVGYTDASGVFHEAVSDAISTDADNALGHGTDGGLYVSASGGNANVKYYETDAQAEADYAAGNIPNDTSVIIRGTKPASDPELHKSDIATLAQIAGGTTTDGKVASAEDVYELNNSITDLNTNLIKVYSKYLSKTINANADLAISFDELGFPSMTNYCIASITPILEGTGNTYGNVHVAQASGKLYLVIRNINTTTNYTWTIGAVVLYYKGTLLS